MVQSIETESRKVGARGKGGTGGKGRMGNCLTGTGVQFGRMKRVLWMAVWQDEESHVAMKAQP